MSAELRRLAEAATPGPWWDRSSEYGQTAPHYGDFGWSVPGCPAGETEDSPQGMADAAYIAAADPQTILALLDRAEAAEAKVARAERLRDELIALPKEPGDSVFAEGYTAGSNEAGYFLRAALAPAPTEGANGRQAGSGERVGGADDE